MRYFFFDLETTGLKRATAKILQIAYIICSEDFTPLKSETRFFATDTPVPVDAAACHGLTQKKLMLLSDGKEFGSYVEELYSIISAEDITFAGHNVLKYDLPILFRTLGEYGYSTAKLSTRPVLDTLILARQKLQGSHTLGNTLTTLLTARGKTLADFDKIYNKVYAEELSKPFISSTFHDATYDTFASFFVALALVA